MLERGFFNSLLVAICGESKIFNRIYIRKKRVLDLWFRFNTIKIEVTSEGVLCSS